MDVEQGGDPLVPRPDLGGLAVDAEGDHGCRIGVGEGVEGESVEPHRVRCENRDALALEEVDACGA